MHQYHQQLQQILANGELRTDRTGTGTKSIFGMQARYDLRDGFPAITTKRLAWKAVVSELLWFLEGSTDERRLAEILHGTRDPDKKTIWTANALNQAVDLGYRVDDDVRDLGPIYGEQWREWTSYGQPVDQIELLIYQLRHEPQSRRHILSAWNAGVIHDMALPPCHLMIQFYVSTDGRLSCQLYQRSADMFLGVPFNIASYALLTHIMAALTGYGVGEFVHSIGDAHIYLNHIDQVHTQLSREHRPLPALLMPEFKNLDSVINSSVDDFKLVGYNPHPTITGDMAV